MNDLDIKKIRKMLGFTQKQLAETVGVSVNTIQNWESGGKIPKSKHPILQSLIAKPHIVYGGQHVQNGDAINGDKIVQEVADVKECVDEVVQEEVNIKKVKCDLDDIRKELADLKKTHAEVVSQNSRLLAIIENLTNPK